MPQINDYSWVSVMLMLLSTMMIFFFMNFFSVNFIFGLKKIMFFKLSNFF